MDDVALAQSSAVYTVNGWDNLSPWMSLCGLWGLKVAKAIISGLETISHPVIASVVPDHSLPSISGVFEECFKSRNRMLGLGDCSWFLAHRIEEKTVLQ